MAGNVFENMKDLYKMQKEAKQLQKQLQSQKIIGVSKREEVTIFMNAAQEFEDIEISDNLLSPDMKEILKKQLKEAFEDFEKKLKKQMQSTFDINDIKSMLGGA